MRAKIGVIFNYLAGKSDLLPLVGQIVQEKMGPYAELITGQGGFGEIFIPGHKRVVKVKSQKIPEAITSLVEEFIKLDVSIIVGIGGDGTLNWIASRILEKDGGQLVMGIGTGTANVGPLLRFNLRELEAFDFQQFNIHEIRPLTVARNRQHLGYAFVDVVIGNTFLGTLEGKMETFDAASFYYEGVKRVTRPSGMITEVSIGKGDKWRVVKNVAQIIISPIHHAKFFVGKAITGPLCWAHYLNMDGVVALASVPVVDPYITHDALEEKEPVKVEFILFSKKEPVLVQAREEGMFVILDGNVVSPMGKGVLKVEVSPKTVKVISNRPFELDCYPLVAK